MDNNLLKIARYSSTINKATCIVGILLLVCELLPFPMMRAIVAKDISPSEQGIYFSCS
jgi:hypothetical protein